ncbi:MAG: chromosome segregation protein SMC [Eubacteriales bacterium]
MLLKRLELYGFKSFADKVEIEFDNGITGVVGPNGSGKSNIGDAVRWVLGEQSAKSLRGSKMEDVIFNGAESRNPLAWCEVNLVFDNSDSTVASEYSDLSVGRRFYRSGESEYYINKQRCRRKEIIDLFRDTGIGKEGYSIIGQGRIEDIISSKPEGRRDLFHEAVGIMKHRSKRDESTRRLENTRANVQRLVDKMDEMERQLKPLKRQCDNARRYLTLSESLKKLEINRFLVLYKKLNENNEYLKDEQKKLEDIEKQCIENAEQTKNSIAAAQSQLDESNAELEAIQQKINQIEKDIASAENEIRLINERINFGMQTKMRLGDEIESANQRSVELKNQADILEQELGTKQEKLNSRKTEIEKYTALVEEKLAEYNKRQKELDQKKIQLIEKVTALSDSKTAVGKYETMIENLLARKEAISRELEAIDGDDTIYSNSKAELQSNIDELDSQIKQMQQKASELNAKRQETKTALADAQVQSREKGVAYRTVENRISILKNMQSDHEGYDRAVKYLLESENAQKYIDGIIGDIIDVPKEYTKAVDIALGRAVQNVVTKDEYDAKELIRQLRENKAGRATFFPLSAIKGRYPNDRERNTLKQKGCFGIAAELIQYDDKYTEIIYSLLGRTAVCENLDVAVELAKQCSFSLRFVTLEGDVVNSGGSMSGGSAKSQSGSILARRTEIAEYEKQLVFVKDSYKQSEKSAEKLSKELEDIQKEMDAHSSAANETNIALVRELEKMDRLNELWGKSTNSKDTLSVELQNIENSLDDLYKSIEEITSSKGDIGGDQALAQEQIKDEQAELNELGESLDELQHELNSLMIRDATDEKELANVKKDIARLRQDSVNVVTDAQKKQSETQGSEQVIKEQEEQIGLLNAKIETLKADLENANLELKTAMEARGNFSSKAKEAAESHEQAREQLLSITEKKFRLETKLDHNDTELINIQNRIWDMYELTYANAQPFKDDEFNFENSGEEIDDVRKKIKNMGTVNVNALEDYTNINERYNEHKVQYDDLIKAESDLLQVIDDLNKHMRDVFNKEFEKLNTYFKSAFTALFGGGEASLIIHDDEDILESGIDIIAQPPGKKLQHLSLLSGGEKALTAIAILFAMLKHRPSPFCLLDEIEAALDEANLNHFSKYLQDYSKETQFVIITHRRGTMESCDRLYGVTMEEKGISKMISVKISDYE